MKDISLSIMMPAFNAEMYIHEAIESILKQTYTDFELIIIDDGSSDHTAAIVSSFNDLRIRMIRHDKNYGVVYSRNHALRETKGEHLAFFDADDVAHPEKFEKQIAFLKNNSGFGLAGSSVYLINEEGKRTGKWKLNGKANSILPHMLFHNYFVNSAVVFRREAINGLEFIEGTDICEDYIMWWQMLQKNRACNLPEFLTSYRLHPQSIGAANPLPGKYCERVVFKMILKDIGLEPSDEELDIHIALRGNEQVGSFSELRRIARWLIRIREHAEISGVFDIKALREIVFNRWMKVCFRSKHNPWLFVTAVFYWPFYLGILAKVDR